MASGPITSWQIDGETMKTVTDFIFMGSKMVQMVTAAMKLKDTCSLEEKELKNLLMKMKEESRKANLKQYLEG